MPEPAFLWPLSTLGESKLVSMPNDAHRTSISRWQSMHYRTKAKPSSYRSSKRILQNLTAASTDQHWNQLSWCLSTR
jgi:hypothetical protein